MPIGSSTNFLVLLVLVFTAVLLLLEALYLLWRGWRGPEARHLKQRLSTLTQPGRAVSVLRQGSNDNASPLGRMVQHLPGREILEKSLVQSGVGWSVSGLVLRSLALAAGALVGTLDFARWVTWLPTAAAIAAGLLPWAYVRFQRSRRLAHIERQLPDALDLITRALRAGHAFTAGLKMAGEELPQPIAGEMRTVHDEISFGVTLEQAFTHLCERVPLTDLRYFTVAVLIQRDSGGNLTEILSDLSALVRERAKLMSRVRVLSTEGKLSAWILGLMPFALGAVMTLLHPKFMSLLWTDPIGIRLLEIMLVLMVIGAFLLRKIARIRV
jgi:tight adherence protein B